MSTGSKEGASKGRREAVWEVCDQLSAQGVKPSLRSVKMHYPRGSDTDVQKDVNAWYEHVFTLHSRRRVIPTLPDSVVKAMEVLWETASVEAESQFVKERNGLQSIRDELKMQLDSTLSDLSHAQSAAARFEQENADLRMELANRSTLLEESNKLLATLQLDMENLRSYSQKREQDLVEEARRQKEAHELHFKVQRDDFELQVNLVREASVRQSEEYQRAMSRAESHYRDLESRSLVEVDAVRTQLKSANEVVERFRALAHERELEIARIRTELKMVSATHQFQIDELRERNRSLSREVEEFRVKAGAVTSGPGGQTE